MSSIRTWHWRSSASAMWWWADSGLIPVWAAVAIYRNTVYRYLSMARKPRFGPASDPELLILASLASGPKHGTR